MQIFEQLESNVRSYCRNFSDLFHTGKDASLFNEKGERFIDFFAGAGALNYGHNNDFIKDEIIKYISDDRVIHGLDMYTTAKAEFLQTFNELVLKKRNLPYKVQFCGPTGTNAVEAALKLARKVKKRSHIFAFMGAFHGMSLGSLSCTSNIAKRAGAGAPLTDVTFMPFPHGFMNSFDTLQYLEHVLTDDHSGIDKPAAVIVETVQAEGGIIVTDKEWLQGLYDICQRHDILLICDEIQVGCGRTGSFFSFERADIVPDIVVLSKSIGGYGFPMSLVLMKPEDDLWKPGEHNGTFRGNQVAFVAASAALKFRETYDFDGETRRKGEIVRNFVINEIAPLNPKIELRGIGLIWGLDFSGHLGVSKLTGRVIEKCYNEKLVIERAGREDCVVKIMPPLIISDDLLLEGLKILKRAIEETLQEFGY